LTFWENTARNARVEWASKRSGAVLAGSHADGIVNGNLEHHPVAGPARRGRPLNSFNDTVRQRRRDDCLQLDEIRFESVA
jgi:hypothetical protein